MFKKCFLIVAIVLTVWLSTSGLALAYSITGSESLWILVPAASSFDGMSLFYGTIGGSSTSRLEYNVWGPTGFSGPIQSNAFASDLSAFYGKSVLFEFKAPSDTVTFQDKALVWDWNVVNGMFGRANSPFAMAFYELGNDQDLLTRWKGREVLGGYVDPTILAAEPNHGDLFYHYNAFSVPSTYNIRSDFINPATPEPASLSLLGLGLLGLMGFKKRKASK
ncbi:MAG: PEP-CTERM sorting domain-containing protein [Candidatus Omnitrophica bacterium]|nr:PEP-CTERM sorting domain-containing protein [Candidatus Omnitrophota bacterium]